MNTGKQILLVATALAVVSGGGITAAAKTKTLQKFSQVKITKHTVSGKTTKYTKVQLRSLQGKKLASGQTNRAGKFKFTLKKQNLSRLTFNLTATKAGYRAQTFKHKVTHPTARPTQTPDLAAPTQPAKPVTPTNTPTSDNGGQTSITPAQAAAIKAKRTELAAAKANCLKIRDQLQPVFVQYTACSQQVWRTQRNLDTAKEVLTAAQASGDQTKANGAQMEINRLQRALTQLNAERTTILAQLQPLEDANVLASYIAGELGQLDSSYVLEDFQI